MQMFTMLPRCQSKLWAALNELWGRCGMERYPHAEARLHWNYLMQGKNSFSHNYENVKIYICKLLTEPESVSIPRGFYPQEAKQLEHWCGVLGMVEAVRRECMLVLRTVIGLDGCAADQDDGQMRKQEMLTFPQLEFLRLIFASPPKVQATEPGSASSDNDSPTILAVMKDALSAIASLKDKEADLAALKKEMTDSTFDGPLSKYLQLHGLHALPLHTQLAILQASIKDNQHAVKPVFQHKQDAMFYAQRLFRQYAERHLYHGMFHQRRMSKTAHGEKKEYMAHAFEQ